MVRKTIDIDQNIYNKFKALCFKKGYTISSGFEKLAKIEVELND